MTDACAWNLNAFCFISRGVFLALRGVETFFRTSPPSPPPPPTGLATPPSLLSANAGRMVKDSAGKELY